MHTRKLSGAELFRVLKQAFAEWMEDNALRLSAALAYYSIFSIAPLLVIAIAIAGWFLGQEAAQGLLYDQLRGLLGPRAAEGVQEMVQSASKPSSSMGAGILGGIVLLVGASGVFGQLKDALNTIWEVRARPGQGIKGFIHERLLSFGMVLVIGFLLLVSLFLTTAMSAIGRCVGGSLPAFLALFFTSVVSYGVVVVLFAAIFKVLPDAEIKWSDVWIGAGATALLFEIGKVLLGMYLGRESTASPYGAAGSAVLLLLWVYYASLILFFGAEFTQVYAQARGSKIQPSPNAQPVTQEARAQQGLGTGSVPAGVRGLPLEPAPSRESLSATFGKAFAVETHADKIHESPRKIALMALGALVGGYAFGIMTRRAEPAMLSPAAEIKHGSKALITAGVAAAAACLSKLWTQGAKAFDQTSDWTNAAK